MSTIYMFNEALPQYLVEAVYRLGPGYSGQFKYPNETKSAVSERDKKVSLLSYSLQSSDIMQDT